MRQLRKRHADLARTAIPGAARAAAPGHHRQVEPPRDDRVLDRLSVDRGSYSYCRVGQYTSFAGAEREQSFDCHFAGEHTSIDFQCYLNGAVETGERAAIEIRRRPAQVARHRRASAGVGRELGSLSIRRARSSEHTLDRLGPRDTHVDRLRRGSADQLTLAFVSSCETRPPAPQRLTLG